MLKGDATTTARSLLQNGTGPHRSIAVNRALEDDMRTAFGAIACALVGLYGLTAFACAPEGKYELGNQDYNTEHFLHIILKVQRSKERSGIYSLHPLDALAGADAGGAAHTGGAKGKLKMSSEGCVGIFIDSDALCQLVFIFEENHVTIYQFDSCMLGLGVDVNQRLPKVRKAR